MRRVFGVLCATMMLAVLHVPASASEVAVCEATSSAEYVAPVVLEPTDFGRVMLCSVEADGARYAVRIGWDEGAIGSWFARWSSDGRDVVWRCDIYGGRTGMCLGDGYLVVLADIPDNRAVEFVPLAADSRIEVGIDPVWAGASFMVGDLHPGPVGFYARRGTFTATIRPAEAD